MRGGMVRGIYYIERDVRGHVTGDVMLKGDVRGHVTGDVHGDVACDVVVDVGEP